MSRGAIETKREPRSRGATELETTAGGGGGNGRGRETAGAGKVVDDNDDENAADVTN